MEIDVRTNAAGAMHCATLQNGSTHRSCTKRTNLPKENNVPTSIEESRSAGHGLRLAAVLANGVLAGASLDQSIKQLPARKKIGSIAYSKYSRAADLGNGIPFYATLGVSAAALTIAAGLNTRGKAAKGAAIISVLHSLVTAKAAPTTHSQRQYSDEGSLSRVFDRFDRWQTLRAGLQVATFALSTIALQTR